MPRLQPPMGTPCTMPTARHGNEQSTLATKKKWKAKEQNAGREENSFVVKRVAECPEIIENLSKIDQGLDMVQYVAANRKQKLS